MGKALWGIDQRAGLSGADPFVLKFGRGRRSFKRLHKRPQNCNLSTDPERPPASGMQVGGKKCHKVMIVRRQGESNRD
jgi:hypothetical protein